jgi:hypothetical protein
MNYQILKNIVDAELQRFETISEEDWTYKISPENWSKKEILGHLCDSALTNIMRFVVSQYKENDWLLEIAEFSDCSHRRKYSGRSLRKNL